ncbi:hypothetical protein V4Y02_24085, partial [Escherichia coli]
YNENYRMLKKAIKEYLRRWKDLPCSLIGRISIVKVTILPTALYRFNEIPIIIEKVTFLIEIEILVMKFIWKK